MKLDRAAGILLHPTSLPGPYGIGDLGPAALQWIDFLADSGASLWQVLPLGLTGFGDSPYSTLSTFAGNPLLISPERLLEDGLLDGEELARPTLPAFPTARVEYGRVKVWKLALLTRAADRFEERASQGLKAEYAAFRAREAAWLDDFALYMAIKAANESRAWDAWERDLAARKPAALEAAREREAVPLERRLLWQFFFARQWATVRAHAKQRGIRILGDVPIFVSHDCADVWRHPELFELDPDGRPTAQAGVPPDYFAPTGQLWGNPLYRWERHREDGYRWWISRLAFALAHFDAVRLDHFRGFAAYWEVPAGAKTAEGGHWRRGPGAELLGAVEGALGELCIVAEDLGDITPDVHQLRDRFGLPGMRVLQFAFAGSDNEFLPHRHVPHSVVYTGTHDNDTAEGWFAGAPSEVKRRFKAYRGPGSSSVAWDLMRMAWCSVAGWSIAPAQDLLELGSRARMNRPGMQRGNWAWRLPRDFFRRRAGKLSKRLRELNETYGRHGTNGAQSEGR
jgi:4-alpha-glucanotransferase